MGALAVGRRAWRDVRALADRSDLLSDSNGRRFAGAEHGDTMVHYCPGDNSAEIAPMEISSNNLVQAVDELVGRGYDHDFRLSEGRLFDATTNANLELDAIGIDAAYRFEPAPGSDDRSNLYAISARSVTIKGLLIDAFDLYQLDLQPLVSAYDDSQGVPTKYGVPKVFKSEFNEDPDRYVLRKGFPDFPECPYGESFSMLGYDTRERRYVWLVTSILKDERLRTETYPGSRS
ncbi:MAG TPA: hypothetical protein VFO35_06080 [Steroidobacteraceae bacterium]|nr:hypothetical protein [Steroidobacteraceae bacterium]